MAGKIFYRERIKVGEGEKKPRFRVIAVAGLDLKVFAEHLKKGELEKIAQTLDAELILLECGKEDDDTED
ncbi:MAG TPA: hypothetical protein PLB81_08390 [Deltaproteobacteria bacterium]|nr:hypothetical protein [Deltaproteobacteria bacterium]